MGKYHHLLLLFLISSSCTSWLAKLTRLTWHFVADDPDLKNPAPLYAWEEEDENAERTLICWFGLEIYWTLNNSLLDTVRRILAVVCTYSPTGHVWLAFVWSGLPPWLGSLSFHRDSTAFSTLNDLTELVKSNFSRARNIAIICNTFLLVDIEIRPPNPFQASLKSSSSPPKSGL